MQRFDIPVEAVQKINFARDFLRYESKKEEQEEEGAEV